MNTSTPAASTQPKPSVHSFIVTYLRDAIVNGDYVPGQRLIEGDLIAALEVSRPALREALRQLEAEQLLKIVPFKGPSVCEITWAQAQEIYEVRELLEAHATARFAATATPDQIRQLMIALEGFEQALSEPMPQRLLVDHARVFFDLILDGCANQVICDVLRGLTARISMLRSKSMSLSGRAVDSAKEMRAIAEAIAKHDPDMAQAAAKNHVCSARNAAQQVLEKQMTARPSALRKTD